MKQELSSVQGTGFADALDKAMRDAGYSASRLAAEATELGTPITAPALRTWVSGRSVPSRANSLDALDNIEKLLGTGSGMLRRYLAANSPTFTTGNDEWQEVIEALQSVYESWQLPFNDGVVMALAFASLTHTIPDGSTVRYLLEIEATYDGVARFVHVIDGRAVGRGPHDFSRPWVVAEHNCEIRRTSLLPHGWVALEVGLPWELAGGECLQMSFHLLPAMCGSESGALRAYSHRATEILGLQADVDVISSLAVRSCAWMCVRETKQARSGNWESTKDTEPTPMVQGTLQTTMTDVEHAEATISWALP